jgi:hypothetical protein
MEPQADTSETSRIPTYPREVSRKIATAQPGQSRGCGGTFGRRSLVVQNQSVAEGCPD